MKLRNLLLFFIAAFWGAGVVAQTNADTLSFSLEEAMSYASKHAYQKISSEFDIKSAKKKIWETIASGLPQIDFSAGYNHSIDVPVSLLPAEIIPEDMRPPGIGPGDKVPVSFSTAYDGNYSISASQMIFRGSYFVGLKATKVFLDLTRHQDEKTEIEIRNAVAKAYFLVLSARDNYNAFQENLEINRGTLRETEAMFENGFRESMDVSQIKLMVREAEKQIVEMKRNEEVAMAVLRFSMGLDEDQPMVLTDELVTLSEQMVADDTPDGWSPLEHIEYKIANTNAESQKLLLKNAKVQYLPEISAFYTFQKTGYGDEWNIFNDEWYKAQFVGLTITMPIFSSGMRHAQVQQQKLAWQKSLNQRQQALRNIQTESLTALTNYYSAIDQLEIAKESRTLAKDIYDKTRVKFANGIIGSFELNQQQGQYVQAQINYVNAVVNLLNARIDYLKAIGML
ncbi:TolC family protein [Thermophagus sp. OGC60D27]|uniref:TolC family protein n=1 Tax=Thermophagus sp. OGC60D27 TaxID=3458415 RepID=UPI00403804DD